tara:strand:- start:1122 stop:1454 length:333 start_codon:yes stop_codon:yes gene_type:complete
MILSQENKAFDCCGSHLQDRITEFTYADLVRSFGEPTWDELSEMDKTRVEWNLTFDLEDGTTTRATIYDYKNDTPLDENKVWSIGGWEPMAATCVNAVLQLDKFFNKEAV